jgi:uncharacterized RDD family membrane protein YckC
MADMPTFARAETHVTLRRGVAQLLDYFLLAPLWLAIDGLFGNSVVNWIATGLVIIVYFGPFQGLTGWTFGKLLVGIRVVNARRRAPGAGAGLIRALPLVFEVFAIVALVLILRSEWRQRAGDRWADTYVVRR